MSQMKELNHLKIPLQDIKNSTQDFNETNFIGKGGYGRVYKGILSWADYQNLPVAIKQLDIQGFQGNKEFYTEIAMLSQYQHENIITLIGFCDDNKEMILVYEYARHGSLDTYLSDPTMLEQLSWQKRLDICVGAASALDYLHNHVATTHRIIHRDIKSGNILLDENWNTKLSDFGLSKICLANQQNTFVVTNLAGTHGYCDPQYERTGILTKESDVYSFGVVLFEGIRRGRLACVFNYHDERRFLPHLVRTCYKNDQVDKIIDHRLREHIMPKALSMYSAIAYQCLHKTREGRPTIAEVVLGLKKARQLQHQQRFSPSPNDNSSGGSRNADAVDDSNSANSKPPPMHDGGDSYALEENGPGIEGFQITGDAKPGGATSPEYVVTADDVDKLIAVECIPMDDQGRQGEIVRLCANQQNKITCGPGMQQEIDKYMLAGQASFNVMLLMDSPDNWEKTTLTLTRSNYQIKVDQVQDIFIQEKYSSGLSIKIPLGLTTQFVLTCSDGSSHRFNTFHDVRIRDTLVLTMRMFQSKALDDRRKSKA